MSNWRFRATTTLATLASVAALTSNPASLDRPFQSSFEKLPHLPCVGLYSRDGRAGCGTISHDAEAGRLAHWTSLPSDGSDYVAAIEDGNFTSENVDALMGDGLVGILVLNGTGGASEGFPSPASAYPSGDLGDGYEWNPQGDSLADRDLYEVAVALIPDAELSRYLLEESMVDSSIVAEFNYYMGPEGETSISCLDWKNANGAWSPTCLPLGGNSVWASTSGTTEEEEKKVVFLATGMDASSMFHDASPGALTAAGDILALILAAQILGGLDLSGLSKDIAVGFFQGEKYGYIGSRRFFKDVYGFQCENDSFDGNGTAICLHPVRPDLAFANLQPQYLVAVDQIGLLATQNTAYVHSTDDFVSNVMLQLSNDYLAVQSSEATDDDGDNAIPPSPLASMQYFSDGDVGGAVLTGYDDAFIQGAGYSSHFDTDSLISIDKDAIAQSAILLAKTAIALAYDDGDEDYETAANYASDLVAQDVISPDDDQFKTLYRCLFLDGNCDTVSRHSAIERNNISGNSRRNDLGTPAPLGTPPSYYVSVLDLYNGLPAVRVGGIAYAAYNGTAFDPADDAILMRPAALEMTLVGLLNEALGDLIDAPPSCKTALDCRSVSTCRSTCAGSGKCVCSKAHYHLALDEAIQPALMKAPMFYTIAEDEEGITPIYTEVNWSPDVGVKVFRRVDGGLGYLVFSLGLAFAGSMVGLALALKKKMIQAEMY